MGGKKRQRREEIFSPERGKKKKKEDWGLNPFPQVTSPQFFYAKGVPTVVRQEGRG